MDWLQEYYSLVAAWCYDNQTATGIIIGLGVAGSLNFLLNRGPRKRHLLRRLAWGAKMRRSRNRLAFEKASLAFAIEDKLFEMVYAGDMTEQSADEWRKSFANYYQMDELLPFKDVKSIKKSIRYRLNSKIHQVKSIIPGPKPEVKVDKTYVPVAASSGTKKSKYAKAA